MGGYWKVVNHFAQPSDVLEGCDPNQRITIIIVRLRQWSSLETMLVVPGQGDRIGTLADLLWCTDLLTMERVVVSTIFEFFLNLPANLKMEAGRYRHIAGIEQAVDVAPQQEPVPWLVFAALAVRQGAGGTRARSLGQGAQVKARPARLSCASCRSGGAVSNVWRSLQTSST